MYSCNNCGGTFDDKQNGLVVTQAGKIISLICPQCADGVRVAKLVLRRGDTGEFGYEQFTALEMMSKAFGKGG